MKTKILPIFIVFLLILPIVTNAQSRKMIKADEYLAAGEYFDASELYVKLYSKAKQTDEKAEISFKLGLCYRQLIDVRQSITWFKRAILYKYQDPIANLYLADAYKMKGLYDEAKEYYANYKDLVPNDQRADNGIVSCDLAVEWLDNPTRYYVNDLSNINSRQNDFAPFVASDTNKIYFTSTRSSANGSNFNSNSGQNFADIFMSQKDTRGRWSQPAPIVGDVNGEFDDGTCFLVPDGRTMYFTNCPVIENENAGCKIYKSTFSSDKWNTPELIEIFQDSSISVGHPFISSDMLTLYFVSDNPDGGQGGKDIWKMTRNSTSDSWRTPTNLGSEINTEYDELYPSMDNEGNLYFSTDGRIGMGGLDIFKATPTTDGWEVKNLKHPVNSSANDFGMAFNPSDNSRGYFSSTRNAAKGDDIYSFYLRPIVVTLNGAVRNDANKAFITDVNVEITGSDGSIIRVQTSATGSFTAKLKANVDYKIVSSKRTYLKATGSVSTKGIVDDGKVFDIELFMNSTVGDVKIPNIRYDLGDTVLRQESFIALDNLIDILNINPTAKIELRAHTDFRGSDPANLKLSQGRANSVVDYLVANGIDKTRLVPKGYGETAPYTVNSVDAATYDFLNDGDVLSEPFINALSNPDHQEICHQLNRRTEFRVLEIDWGDNYETFGD